MKEKQISDPMVDIFVCLINIDHLESESDPQNIAFQILVPVFVSKRVLFCLVLFLIDWTYYLVRNMRKQ